MASERWSALPIELLEMIFRHLTGFDDISHCAGVCVYWQYVIKSLYPQFKPYIPPYFLMLANVGVSKNAKGKLHRCNSQRCNCSNKDSCVFFNLQTNKAHELSLPELKGRWFSSSSHGWLLTTGFNSTQNIHLLNPFTREQIKLPPPGKEFNERELQFLRVVTSACPSDPDCEFLATEGRNLAFCTAGDKTWTSIKEFHGLCSDIIFYKDEFYAIDDWGELYIIDLDEDDDTCPKAVKLRVRAPLKYSLCYYLVEVKGELLLVLKFFPPKEEEKLRHLKLPRGCNTLSFDRFEAYGLDWRGRRWLKVESIGYNAILLGRSGSQSVAVSANHNESRVFEPNCIYFIDDGRRSTAMSKVADEEETGFYEIYERKCYQWLDQDSPIWSNPLSWFIA